MKILLPLLFALSISATAQTPDPKPADPKPPDPKPAAVAPKLHADVLKLVELTGARQQVQASFAQSLADGQKTMMAKCPNCTPEFGAEWVKRMSQRLSPDPFVAVFVEEYEKYLNDTEVLELISLRENASATPAPVPSEELKTKLGSVMPSLMGEVMGRCTQIAAKLGGEVGGEIGKEHPEYLKADAASPKP